MYEIKTSAASALGRLWRRALAALLGSFVLVGVAPAGALTITSLTPTLSVAAGGQATAKFEFDWGDTPVELLAFDLALTFDPGLLGASQSGFAASYAGAAPNLAGGNLVGFDLPGAVTFSWAYDHGDLPSLSGKSVLSVKFDNLALANGASPLTLGLLYSTLDADDMSAGAQVLVTAVPAVPEPATWLLLLPGIGMVLLQRRRLGRE
jgi:hypothetical protein